MTIPEGTNGSAVRDRPVERFTTTVDYLVDYALKSQCRFEHNPGAQDPSALVVDITYGSATTQYILTTAAEWGTDHYSLSVFDGGELRNHTMPWVDPAGIYPYKVDLDRTIISPAEEAVLETVLRYAIPVVEQELSEIAERRTQSGALKFLEKVRETLTPKCIDVAVPEKYDTVSKCTVTDDSAFSSVRIEFNTGIGGYAVHLNSEADALMVSYGNTTRTFASLLEQDIPAGHLTLLKDVLSCAVDQTRVELARVKDFVPATSALSHLVNVIDKALGRGIQ